MNISGAKGVFSIRDMKKDSGGIRDCTKMMTESREQAIDWMIEEAENLGANAIINARFTTSMIMQSASEILAYGTAVVVE
jgi:uncharacterized protein YbjQ (UPF0145 family)